jgi:hypothetical protein
MDDLVPVNRARLTVELLEKAGARVIYCEENVGHKLSANCFRGMGEFFKEHAPGMVNSIIKIYPESPGVNHHNEFSVWRSTTNHSTQGLNPEIIQTFTDNLGDFNHHQVSKFTFFIEFLWSVAPSNATTTESYRLTPA